MTEREKKQSQKRAVEALLEKGIDIEIKHRSILRYIVPKTKWHVSPPTLGVLYGMAGEFAQMEMEEEKIDLQPLNYGFALARENAENLSRALAVSFIGGRMSMGIVGRLVARYLMWHMTPAEMFAAVVSVITMSGTADFINSIRLIKGIRLTEAKGRVE
ncbi:MAG: hypothetical protein PHD21_03230 [Flavobacteriales bacterium]|nr:hypothetical protein [Flavobacteriales bacterium]